MSDPDGNHRAVAATPAYSEAVCMQCVASSAPYVAVAVGGLRVMGWNARRAGSRLGAGRGQAAHRAMSAPSAAPGQPRR